MTRVTVYMLDKQKHNWRINGQKIIELYNASAFITNESKIIKICNYSYPKG